jgi:hypothetical protein
MKDSILNAQFEKLAFFGSSNTPQMRVSNTSNPGTPGYWGTRQSSNPEQFNPRTAGLVAGTGAAVGTALGAARGGLRGGLKGGAIGLGIGALGYLGRNYMHNRLDKSKTYGNYRGNTQMHRKPAYSNATNRYANSSNYSNNNIYAAPHMNLIAAGFGAGATGLASAGVRSAFRGVPYRRVSMSPRAMLLGAGAGLGYSLYRNFKKAQ